MCVCKGKSDCKAGTVTLDGSSGAVTPTCTTQTVDLVGGAFGEQGKDPNQLKLTLNAAASPSSCHGPLKRVIDCKVEAETCVLETF